MYSLFTTEIKQIRHTWLPFYDVTHTNCRAQNGSILRCVFTTCKRRFLTKKTRNLAKKLLSLCFNYIFYSNHIEREHDAPSARVPFNADGRPRCLQVGERGELRALSAAQQTKEINRPQIKKFKCNADWRPRCLKVVVKRLEFQPTERAISE